MALRWLLGAGAPLSVSRWCAPAGELAGRVRHVAAPLAGRPGARVRLGRRIYMKACLEEDKAEMLALIAPLRDGGKVVLAVESGYRESTESWATVVRDLQRVRSGGASL